MSQLHYRGKDSSDPTRLGHSVESHALATALCVLPSRRQLPPAAKHKCLLLLSLLLQAAIGSLPRSNVQPGSISGHIYDVTHAANNVELVFDENGMTRGFASLPELSPRCVDAWQKLSSCGWCGRTVSSTLELMSLWDLTLFCSWSKALQNAVWQDVFRDLYPQLVQYMGNLLQGHCLFLAGGGLKPLPILQTRAGHTRRMPRVNKVILLRRCRQQRRNREEVLATHTDISSKKPRMVKHEAILEVALYMQKLVSEFANTVQVQVSWGESHYDSSKMVLAIFDHKTKKAAFLPIQQMQPVYIEELSEEMKLLSFEGKAQRVEGFATIRALSHSLSYIGLPLQEFQLDAALIIRPLQSNESRIYSDGIYWVVNEETQEVVRQIPEGVALDELPMLVSCSDQGPMVLSGLDMLQYHSKLSMHSQYDPYHRCWTLSFS